MSHAKMNIILSYIYYYIALATYMPKMHINFRNVLLTIKNIVA